MSGWFYDYVNGRVGPLGINDVKAHVAKGRITRETILYNSVHAPKGIAAGKYGSLFEQPRSAGAKVRLPGSVVQTTHPDVLIAGSSRTTPVKHKQAVALFAVACLMALFVCVLTAFAVWHFFAGQAPRTSATITPYPNQATEHKMDSEDGSILSTLNRPDARVAPGRVSDPSTLVVADLMPRPIKTERDAQTCFEASNALAQSIKDITGLDDNRVTTRLHDCVVSHDPDDGGYTKYYPDGAQVRLDMQGDHAYLRVLDPGMKKSTIHIAFWAGRMSIHCSNIEGTQDVGVVLSCSSDGETFDRLGQWNRFDDPDLLERFCIQVYHDYQQLRR